MKTLIAVTALATLICVAYVFASTNGKSEDVVAEVKKDVKDTSKTLEVKAVLTKHFGADAMNVDVAVDQGVVSLSGEVDERATLELSEEVVKSLDDVIVVHNFLSHTSDVDSASSFLVHAEIELRDAALETKVKGDLTANIGDTALDINVEACDGVVSLRGKVPDDERRDIAVRVASENGDVRRVIDLLEVAS